MGRPALGLLQQSPVFESGGGVVGDDGQEAQVAFGEGVGLAALNRHRSQHRFADDERHKHRRARRVGGDVARPGRERFALCLKILHQQVLLALAHPAHDAKRVRGQAKGNRRAALAIHHPDQQPVAVAVKQAKLEDAGVYNLPGLLVNQLGQAAQVEL